MQDSFKLKSSFILITGVFSCRISNWYLGDLVTPHGTSIKALTSFYGFHQLIKTPIHPLHNSATCTDLLFTNQLHLVMESGVHSRQNSTCHHETVFVKLSLNVEYPPPYERIFCDYSRADKDSINRATNAIDCEELFAK